MRLQPTEHPCLTLSQKHIGETMVGRGKSEKLSIEMVFGLTVQRYCTNMVDSVEEDSSLQEI